MNLMKLQPFSTTNARNVEMILSWMILINILECVIHLECDTHLLAFTAHYLRYVSFLWMCNKGPQTGWLNPTEIYFLTFLEVRNPKSRCHRAMLPLKA